MKTKQIRTEIVAGITTFFTMAYIVILNPAILSETGMPFSGVMTATVLLCFSMTLLMGVYAKLPYAVAPGMGINAFFTFTLVLRNQIPWPTALGIVFWSGVLFLVCSLTPIRIKIAQAIPKNLRLASAIGIGIFLTFIGLKNSKLIIGDPVTLVRLGPLDRTTILALIGLSWMTVWNRKKNPLAFLTGIGLVTLLALFSGLVKLPEQWTSPPDFQSVGLKLDLWGALKLVYLPSIIAIFFTDLFDSISTFMGCSYATGQIDSRGQPIRLREGLIVDAWATLTAGLFGTSSGTAYMESAAGMEVGGKTGLTSIVTALCFLPCLFLGPLVGIVPDFATAPVLILVGAMMFRSVKDLHIQQFEELVPTFLTIVLIPLTFSITQGILWGLLSHVVLFALSGRKKEISPTLWWLAVLSVALLWLEGQ